MKVTRSEVFNFDDIYWSAYEIEKARTDAEACRDKHNGEMEFVEGHVTHSETYGSFYAGPECWPKYIVYWEEETKALGAFYNWEPIRDSDERIIPFKDVESARAYVRCYYPNPRTAVFRPILGACKCCGGPLFESDIEGYYCQCFNCDEDFYAAEQNLETEVIEK